MRVLLVNAHGADAAYGGAERYVRDLAEGLTGAGHTVQILSAFPEAAPSGFETVTLHQGDWRDDAVRRIKNHVGDLVSAPWPQLGEVIDEITPDVIHTNNLPGIGTGVWEVARRRGVAAIHTLHDYQLLCPRTSLQRRDGSPCRPSPILCGARTRRMLRWSGGVSEVIAGSNHLITAHQGHFASADSNVIRLPLAPLGEDAVTQARNRPRVAGYLGALTRSKGVEMLLAAAPRLADLGIELRIAGDGPLREVVETSGVTYVGRVEGEAKLDFIASCDIGFVPSMWAEPSGPPYVVLEWLAGRRPVLITRNGGLAEAAAIGGVLTFDPTPEGLAKVVATQLEDERWSELVAALPVVEGPADVERWIDEHRAVYTRATAGRQ